MSRAGHTPDDRATEWGRGPRALLRKFIASFQKAISAEMDAMRQRQGPFEVPLRNGQAAGTTQDAADARAYSCTFDVLAPNDKLVLHGECTLTHDAGEHLVTIAAIDRDRLTLECDHRIPLTHDQYTLVIYPWFLYEKLKTTLESLLETDSTAVDGTEMFIENGLRLFGKLPAHQTLCPVRLDHSELNATQSRAVQLCCDSDLAFVWGPPGTGKTTTLGHIVAELLHYGHRVLITSTTNAAVDQALAKLAALPGMHEAFDRGDVVRAGQIHGETFGAALTDVVNRLNSRIQDRRAYVRNRLREAQRQAAQCDVILNKLDAASQPSQTDMFVTIENDPLNLRDVASVFAERHARFILTLDLAERRRRIARRKERLKRLILLCTEQIDRLSGELRARESTVVQRARAVLATMTNMYISRLLRNERFDVVVVEEAGMAVLPTLFYCASLARTKVIMVGDPKQLPPIVQSRSAIVRRAMGRSIFEVTIPARGDSDMIVMLDTQYRMHPVIGDLVSALFYDGRLRHGDNTRERSSIARRRPYPGEPLVVVDTRGRTTCAVQDGGFSRFNETTARLCVDLALEAVRDSLDAVAIITPYVEQSRRIRRLLTASRANTDRIECQTVHRFQGNERDLVIFDTVDTAPLPPGVLLSGGQPGSSASNLVNVSLSRAKGKLIILADLAYFDTHAPGGVVAKVLSEALERGTCVPLDTP